MPNSLSREFLAFKSRPFPKTIVTGDPTLDDLLLDFHADLAEFDGHVAGIVDRLARAGKPSVEQELVMDESLKRRAGELSSRLSAKHHSAFNAYLGYLDALEQLICTANQE